MKPSKPTCPSSHHQQPNLSLFLLSITKGFNERFKESTIFAFQWNNYHCLWYSSQLSLSFYHFKVSECSSKGPNKRTSHFFLYSKLLMHSFSHQILNFLYKASWIEMNQLRFSKWKVEFIFYKMGTTIMASQIIKGWLYHESSLKSVLPTGTQLKNLNK